MFGLFKNKTVTALEQYHRTYGLQLPEAGKLYKNSLVVGCVNHCLVTIESRCDATSAGSLRSLAALARVYCDVLSEKIGVSSQPSLAAVMIHLAGLALGPVQEKLGNERINQYAEILGAAACNLFTRAERDVIALKQKRPDVYIIFRFRIDASISHLAIQRLIFLDEVCEIVRCSDEELWSGESI